MFGMFKGQMKRGFKLAMLGLAGGAAAKVGGYAARRASDGIAGFAAESEAQGAIVDLGAGLVVDAVGLGVYKMVAGRGKSGNAKVAAIAGPVIGGTVIAAALPVVMTQVGPTLEGFVDRLPLVGSSPAPVTTQLQLAPAGAFSDGLQGGLAPAGAYSRGNSSGLVPAGAQSTGYGSGLIPLQ